jgi:hypothetical protein
MPSAARPVHHACPACSGEGRGNHSPRGSSEALDGVHAAIRAARRPLPPRELDGANYRRWAVAVCAAETKHAADDFWACAHRLELAGLFDRDDSFGGHEAPFRFPHETHAVAAMNWLSHLQAHESDRHGPWAAVRWHTWDAGQRREWFARRRILWSGFVRQVERYREARRQLVQVTSVTAPSSSGVAMAKNFAPASEPLCRSMPARPVKR